MRDCSARGEAARSRVPHRICRARGVGVGAACSSTASRVADSRSGSCSSACRCDPRALPRRPLPRPRRGGAPRRRAGAAQRCDAVRRRGEQSAAFALRLRRARPVVTARRPARRAAVGRHRRAPAHGIRRDACFATTGAVALRTPLPRLRSCVLAYDMHSVSPEAPMLLPLAVALALAGETAPVNARTARRPGARSSASRSSLEASRALGCRRWRSRRGRSTLAEES